MNRNFGIGILIFCFGLSSINLGWAAEVMPASPVNVQQVELGEINMEMLEQDRINREQEMVISGLIDENQKLAAGALAQNPDATLEKINQTMINYRDSILSRDKTNAVTDAQRASKYYDLITLTENVDDMKSARQTLQLRWDVIYGKHRLLTDLSEELTALNEELEKQAVHGNPVGPDPQQEAKIQMLTQRLGEMDKKISGYDEIISQKDQQIAQLTGNLTKVQGQVDLLKSELEDKIAQEKNQGPQNAVIKNQEEQIVQEKDQGPQDAIIKNQEEQIAQISEKLNEKNDQVVLLKSELENKIAQGSDKFKEQAQGYDDEKNQIMTLRDKIQQQFTDEKAKDESIRWLNQVLAVAKNKAAYYQLISDQDKASMTEVQGEVQKIKSDFAQRFKDYGQFEDAIASLKSKVSALNWQLSQAKDQSKQGEQLRNDLQAQLRESQAQIVKMKADKEVYIHNAALQTDDRINLAKQLIDLQEQEASLLEEKSQLEAAQNTNFENRFRTFETKTNALLADRQSRDADLKKQMDELKNELDQKQGQVQNLQAQLQDKEAQVAATKSQSDQMTAMMGDYQKKLETKGNDFNEELKQVLSAKNAQAQMQAQVVDLNVKLHEKEAEVMNLKKDIYDLKELNSARDKDAQANELDVSMVQQKMVAKKINEYQAQINGMQAVNAKQVQEIAMLNAGLAMARKKLLARGPSSDEVEFLRTGFKKATMELKQKDAMILQIKANAQEYQREFKAQSREFQSLKDQLQDAQEEIGRRDEDLKYKNMEITRLKLKSHTKMSGSDLSKEELQAQLMDAKAQIKDLHKQLDQFILPAKNNPLEEKLKQALDKIDQQGQVINELVQKLQDAGKSVNLNKLGDKDNQ